MNPGKLDRRITIQKRTLTRGDTGARVESWADDYKLWAEKLDQRAAEKILGRAEKTENILAFRVRHCDSMDSTTNRVSYRGAVYDINSMIEEGIKRWLVIECANTEEITA